MEPTSALLGVMVVVLVLGIIAGAVLLWQPHRPDGNAQQDTG